MSHTKVPLCFYYNSGYPGNHDAWADEMVEMVRAYIRGEPIFMECNGSDDQRRTGSIARLSISDSEMQNLLYGDYDRSGWGYNRSAKRELLPVTEENIKAENFKSYRPDYTATWDKRKNSVTMRSGYAASWLKGYDATQGTVWKWAKPDDEPQVVPEDKLGREIKKGDFISYILYHFDNGRNGAGIYYGKVTKIENDGTVHAKNIKLSEDDHVAEKRIKDNSLIVIMSKDLMDKLMMARLAIL